MCWSDIFGSLGMSKGDVSCCLIQPIRCPHVDREKDFSSYSNEERCRSKYVEPSAWCRNKVDSKESKLRYKWHSLNWSQQQACFEIRKMKRLTFL